MYREQGTDYSHEVGYTYDLENNLTALKETINGTTHTTGYTYDEDNRLSSVTNGTTEKVYNYDSLGRTQQQVTKDGDTTVKTDSFTFRSPTSTTTSLQVSTHTVTAPGFSKTYTYTYDGNGNILSISDGTYTNSYAYDSAGQLLRENNQAGGFTRTWEYTCSGGIISHTEYAYTTGTLGTPTKSEIFVYGHDYWGDIQCEESTTHDGVGNPLTDGVWTYTWEHGRQLAAMSNSTTTWNYTYNADGMRTQRSNGTTTYRYIYNGSTLSRMTMGTDTLDFIYDAVGQPMKVFYNGTAYYYVTNLQGDVVGILNSAGQLVVSYSYDAWGNPLSATGTMAATLGTINPLRYRSYVYDTETGLYYLQSRYYNPELGRFINADAYLSTGQGILGHNAFAYCLNNPVSYIDRNGTNAVILRWWTTGMGWLPFVDTALPIGDIIYIGGILLLGVVALASDQNSAPEIAYDIADVSYRPPSPNHDDDDDDDDYYDNEDNFGGRQKVGKNKGNAPRNNRVQNKQARDAAKTNHNRGDRISYKERQEIHRLLNGQGYSYKQILDEIRFFGKPK